MNALRYLIVPIIAVALLASTQADDDKWTPERRHPGHQMQAEYLPAKDAFTVGESVDVVLRITNVGDSAFRFLRGGRQRGARDNQFALNAQFGTRMLPDIGDPVHFGGLAAYVLLKPGEHVDIPVDLTKWFAFEEDGTYLMRGSYYMAFAEPDSNEYSLIWEDYATAEFTITISDE